MIQVILIVPPGVDPKPRQLRERIAESIATEEGNIQIIALTGGELSYMQWMGDAEYNLRGQIFAYILGTDYALRLPGVPSKIRAALDTALGQVPKRNYRRLHSVFFLGEAFAPSS